jgi:hypothetical protein
LLSVKITTASKTEEKVSEAPGTNVVVTPDILASASVLYQESKDASDNKNKSGVTASAFYLYEGALNDAFNYPYSVTPKARNLLNLYVRYDFAKSMNLRPMSLLALFVRLDNALDQPVYRPAWGAIVNDNIPFIPGRTFYLGIDAGI